MYLLILLLAEAAAAGMIIWAAYGLRRTAVQPRAGRIRSVVTLLSFTLLTAAVISFATLIISPASAPPREVDEGGMAVLFLGVLAALCGGFLAASSLDAVRDTLWPPAAALLPAFAMFIPFVLQPEDYGTLLRVPLVALVLIAAAFVVWSGFRWWRRHPPKVSTRGRVLMTRMSLIALVVSILLATVVLAFPSAFAGLGDEDRPKAMVFLVGLAGTLLGGFMAASATEASRDRLWPAGVLQLFVWVALINELEPGAW